MYSLAWTPRLGVRGSAFWVLSAGQFTNSLDFSRPVHQFSLNVWSPFFEVFRSSNLTILSTPGLGLPVLCESALFGVFWRLSCEFGVFRS